MKKLTIIALTTGLSLPTGAWSQQAPPAFVDFPAASVEDVVVPVPSEVFAVLDKLGSPNWRGQMRDSFGKQTGSRAQVALLLGTVIADGFVAVEAEDSETVKEIGRNVLNLAEAINVRDAVIARSKSITEKADRGQWMDVRREFDGAMQDVRGAMRELNDDDLAHLVSLGGWIRGTNVLTSIIELDYKPDKAELLHQPDLVAYFSERIDDMPSGLKGEALVGKIRETLPKIRPLIGETSGDDIPIENVREINEMSSELVEAIASGETR